MQFQSNGPDSFVFGFEQNGIEQNGFQFGPFIPKLDYEKSGFGMSSIWTLTVTAFKLLVGTKFFESPSVGL